MGYVSDLRKKVGSQPIVTVGATIIVINQKKEILFQHRSDTFDWGLPGGSMALGEKLEQVAARELKEETGLEAEDFELLGVFSGKEYYFRYPNGDETYDEEIKKIELAMKAEMDFTSEAKAEDVYRCF